MAWRLAQRSLGPIRGRLVTARDHIGEGDPGGKRPAEEIQRAQPHRLPEGFDCRVRLAAIATHQAAHQPGLGGIRIECQRAVEGSGCHVVLPPKKLRVNAAIDSASGSSFPASSASFAKATASAASASETGLRPCAVSLARNQPTRALAEVYPGSIASACFSNPIASYTLSTERWSRRASARRQRS